MKAVILLSLVLLTGCETQRLQTNMPSEYRKLYAKHVADPTARLLISRVISAHYTCLATEWNASNAFAYSSAQSELAIAKAAVASYLRIDPSTLTDLNENLKP